MNQENKQKAFICKQLTVLPQSHILKTSAQPDYIRRWFRTSSVNCAVLGV